MKRLVGLIRDELHGLNWRTLLARVLLAPLPRYVGGRVRPAVLRLVGFQVGPETVMWGTPYLSGPADLHRSLRIGQGCWFNYGCQLELGAAVEIGAGVSVGHQVMVLTTTHEVGPATRRAGEPCSRPVRIGRGVWLGSRCLVLPGVTIGEGAIVAAGALVNRDVPPHTLVAGVPARVVRQLDTAAPSAQTPEAEAAPGAGR